jgi:hypothetical protein
MKRAGFIVIFALGACASTAPTPEAKQASGSISGVIQYQGHVIPAMRICAIDAQSQAAGCMKTMAGHAKYTITQLPAGEYRIIADVLQWQLTVGGHMQQVQCIRAPCPPMLKPVTLQAGQVLDAIDLNGFYYERKDFPVLPKEESR